MSLKRKRTPLTIEQKSEILQRLDKGEKASKIAQEYNIGKSTVTDIKKARPAIEKFITQSDTSSALKRKSMKTAEDQQLDQAVFLWFSQQREKGVPVSGPMLQEKAAILRERIHETQGTDHIVSSGWLQRFKDRHGIRQLSVLGEQKSVDDSIVEEYREKIKKIIQEENYEPEQLYNADESGLFWRAMPDKTLASASEKHASGHKISKDRITIFPCVNATGTHKLPLVCIGRYANPRCFKNHDKNLFPVKYLSQNKAWMTYPLFSAWFEEEFVPAVRRHLAGVGLEQRALLIVDNAGSHSLKGSQLESSDGAIKCMFLPPNTTSKLQPLDQGIIATMKKHYRRYMLRAVVDEDNADKGLPEIIKSFNVKDALFMIADAWDNIKPSTVTGCWYNSLCIGSRGSESGEGDAREITGEVVENCRRLGLGDLEENEIDAWMECDNNMGTEILDDEEIVNIVKKQDECESVDAVADKENQSPVPPAVPVNEAIDGLRLFMDWYEAQDEVDAVKVMNLRQMLSFAKSKKQNKLKQQRLDLFFRK